MNAVFSKCSSLSSLPDISKWNIDKVIYLDHLFSSCSYLSSLPNISKWNTNKVIYMSGMFGFCEKLLSFLNGIQIMLLILVVYSKIVHY